MYKNWVQWFEIPVYQFDKAKAFYEAIFQVELQVVDLGALTMAMFPPEIASGALCQGEWYHPSSDGVTLHVSVADIDKALQQVEPLGGHVLQAKKQISAELGYMALINDCEGNRLALRAPY
ncbi:MULTISPECIES: VOC family protein [unclassified Spirosoma]|uniref:VOC family protein n=1 Tax=unclassified Spirosoma TaxID=2621999 RepID=UPI0009634918|nr:MULTISPECIES: VOC family protein [unclassified Spirosoma]MBN8822189.1 VOC family protein [Spirosoma sp.]OJW72490.1 MAG: hypothetical protein BGO59_15300 [Spirosoma sp. 48-14]